MKSTRGRIFLALAVIVGIPTAAVLFYYTSSQQAFHRYERRLAAAGEKLKVSDWLPLAPPGGKNGAMLFRQAMSSLPSAAKEYLGTNGPHAMKMCAPGKAIVAWAQPEVSEEVPASWADEEQVFEQAKPALLELENIASRPWLDFDLDYYQGFTLLLPHLSQLKAASQQLAFAAVFDLHRKDAAAAARRIHTTLTLVQGMREERTLITQLIRIAMAHIAMTPTWELLQAPDVPDDMLAELQRHWSDLEFLNSAENAMGMERAMSQLVAEQMRNSSAQFRAISSGSMGGPSPSIFSSGASWYDKAMAATTAKSRETLWRLAWSYPDQLRAMRGNQALIESLRMLQRGEAFNVALDAQNKKLAAAGIERPKEEEGGPKFDLIDPELASLFSNGVRSLEKLIVRVLKMECTMRLTTTAIALKRFQQAQGHLPETLDALAPKYLAAVPRDPADGRPLRYRLEPNGGFTLYCVGEDCEDNGGDAGSKESRSSFMWQGGRDIVWPQPATGEEAQRFLKSQIEKRRKR